MQSAATLTLIAALGMIAGRRGNARFCLEGGRYLLQLALLLAVAGPIWFLGSYWQQMRTFKAALGQMLAPLFMPAGLPWSLSLLAWLAGCAVCYVAIRLTQVSLAALQEDRYALAEIRLPLIFSFCAAALFFSTFMLMHWPFGGLPENIGWDRVIMAIWRNATSNYFLALSNGGIIALLTLIYLKRAIPFDFISIAARWLAFWGVAGLLPYALTHWGYAIGARHARGLVAQGLKFQITSLALLTGAGICCALLLWKPRFLIPLAWAAFGLLLARSFLPLVFGH